MENRGRGRTAAREREREIVKREREGRRGVREPRMERRMDRQRNYSRMLRSGNGAFYCAFVIVKLSGQFCVGPIYAHVSRCVLARYSPPAPKWHVMLDCIILQNSLPLVHEEKDIWKPRRALFSDTYEVCYSCFPIERFILEKDCHYRYRWSMNQYLSDESLLLTLLD